MNNEKFANIYRIKSPRATWHDYNGGMYFVTICTKNRKHYFGRIVGTRQRRNRTIIDGTQNRRDAPTARLQRDKTNQKQPLTLRYCRDAPMARLYNIVTGNGVPQMILSEIGKCANECIRKIETLHNNVFVPLYVVMPNHVHLIVIIDGTDIVETRHWRVSTTGTNNTQNETMQSIAKRQSTLSKIINQMKGTVTKYARQNHIDFAWQPRFHDHIIRNQNEMNRIAKYIENNVANWHG